MNDNDPRHLRLLEAILFASADPLSERALTHRLPEGVDLQELLKELHIPVTEVVWRSVALVD